MPEVEIRPAVATDIKTLISLEHSSETDYVWQVDIHRETGHAEAFFREVRLPRTVPVIYPRSTESLVDDWNKGGMLVAVVGGLLAGYVRIVDQMVPGTAWITDVVVARRFRRKGVGTTLVISAQQWSTQRGNKRMVIELQSKNHPCIRLVQKLGYEFCGYNDQYYATRDVALFFGRMI